MSALLVLKRCGAQRAQILRRFRALRRPPDHGLVVEQQLFEHEGALFSLRPFVEGRSLREPGGSPVCSGLASGIPILLGAAQDVARLHRRGIAHGNLHGGNVVIDPQGEARVVDVLGAGAIPPAGDPAGVPRELGASPEQLLGAAPSVRGDVYSLGVLAFMLFTGRHPFSHQEWLELVRRVLYDEPRLSAEQERAIPPPVLAWLRRAMAKQPERRFSNVGALVAALQAAVPAPLERAAPKAVLGHRTLAGLWLGLGTSIVWAKTAASGPVLRLLQRLRDAPRPARIVAASMLIAAMLGGLSASRFSAERILERRVEKLLSSNDAAHARQFLLEEQRRGGDSATIEKLLGDVACARGQNEECMRYYRKALEGSSRYASDATVRKNTLALLGKEDRGWHVASVAGRLLGIEGILVEGTQSESYWKRWSCVRALETRGAARLVDYGLVYSLDVLHAGSCQTRRAALSQLVQLEATSALPSLQEARRLASRRRDDCLEDELPRAIQALESRR